MGKRISAKGNFDERYLFACLALAGYDASKKGIAKVLNCDWRKVDRGLRSGNFSRVDMIKIAKACSMDSYDFIRCFFTDLLRDDTVRDYALKDLLTHFLIEGWIEDETGEEDNGSETE